MNLSCCRTDLPIVLLYNLDPTWPPEDIDDRETSAHALAAAIAEVGHPVQELCVDSADLPAAVQNIHPDKQLILNWCEELPGILHSSPLVAQTLEEMGYTFTGADSLSLALSEDKRKVKQLLHKMHIPTPAWQVYTSDRQIGWTTFPAIVKPAFEHCSFGITRQAVVQNPNEVKGRVQYVLDELGQPALIEEFIDSREFHVGAIGNGSVQVLPAGEIDYSAFPDIHDRLCTYESNFDKTSLAYKLTAPKLPAELSDDELAQLAKIVIAAYRAIGCRDYARMDVRLRAGVFYLLDVNPNPDISPDTSFALGAALAGISYGKLGSLFVNLAAQRHPKFSQYYPAVK